MSQSPGWDYPQRPAPNAGRPPLDPSGEPVGYNLSDLPRYEQPPPQLQPRYRIPSLSLADKGFRISITGLLTSLFLVTSPIAVVGVVISAIALRRSQPGDKDHATAMAGLVVGILALLVALLVLVEISTSHP